MSLSEKNKKEWEEALKEMDGVSLQTDRSCSLKKNISETTI